MHPGISSRLTLSRLLESVGCPRIATARDGMEALQCFATEPADLLLFAWELDGVNGEEFMRAIRKLRQGRSLALVLLDDGLDQQTVVKAVKAGLAARLEAPWRSGPLRRILADLVWDWSAELPSSAAG